MTQFKVGLLAASVFVLIAYMSMQVSEDPNYLGRTKKMWFLVRDASGLIKNSSVKMAGINVGVIKDIRLEDGLAHVDLIIRDEVSITNSGSIEIRANGILGDKYIEIRPGDPSDPLIEDGGQITKVENRGSMDALLTEVSNIAKSVGTVATTLQESVVDEGTNKHILGRIVKNIERLTQDLSEMTSDNKNDIRDVVARLKNITTSVDEFVNGEGEDGFKSSWATVRGSLAKLDRSLDNLEQITEKVNKGEGTIGKLVNDDTTAEKLDSTIDSLNDFLDSTKRLQTSIDFNTTSMTHTGGYRSSLGVIIQPGLDRYYDIQIIDDPHGVEDSTETRKDMTPGGHYEESETKTFKNKVKFTALFAKNFYDITLRGGLIENTGGFGMDYSFFRKRFRFSLDVFDLGHVNVRPYVRYNFFKGIYVIGGVDDLLNRRERYSSYLGAGVFLTNDDLKIFASKVSF